DARLGKCGAVACCRSQDISARQRRGPDGLPLAARRRPRRSQKMNVVYDQRMSRQAKTERPPFQVSFEFFPPKTDVMEMKFWESIDRLAPLRPRFVSVTYGAGGTTRERTLRMVSRIKAETGVDPAAHLTCVGASRDEVDAVVR